MKKLGDNRTGWLINLSLSTPAMRPDVPETAHAELPPRDDMFKILTGCVQGKDTENGGGGEHCLCSISNITAQCGHAWSSSEEMGSPLVLWASASNTKWERILKENFEIRALLGPPPLTDRIWRWESRANFKLP